MKLHAMTLTLAASFALAPLSRVQADPIVYTVTTGGANATNLLAEATVEIDDNGTVSTANFADVTFAPDSIFRKRGEGFLKSCSGMGEFTGEVHIEEGALIIDDVGQLGPTVEKSATDPLVVVSNGASLVVAYGGDTRNGVRFCGGLRIAGDGYQGLGAVRSDSTQRIKYLFSSNITLDGDTTIVNASVTPGDTNDSINDRSWGVKAGTAIDLGGHTLSLKGNQFVSYNVSFLHPGHVIIKTGGEMQFYGYARTWNGSAENTLTIEADGCLDFAGAGNSTPMIESPWTLVLEDGAKIMSSASTSAGDITSCYWAGPVLLNGRAIVANDGNTKGIALPGLISGSGGFELGRGGLELVSSSNSFAGGVRANMSGTQSPTLGLWSGTSLPSPLTATNANLSLSTPVTYQLPRLSFHAASGKTLSAAGGAGGTAASLEKTGPGILELTAPLAVTGGVTLAGGTLRLSSEFSAYSPAPGLVESILVTGGSSDYNSYVGDWYTYGTAMNTNAIVPLANVTTVSHASDSKANTYSFTRYKGYIWNRSNENVTWTFALSMQMSCKLYIDNSQSPIIEYTVGNWKNAIPNLKTLILAPGAHYFDLRMANTTYQKAGPRNDGNNADVVNWPLNYGFVIDFEGRGSYDGDNYSIPSNNIFGLISGGDGSLFTIDARSRDDVTGDDYTRASFPVLDATPGTTLDLNAVGCTFTVQELSGMAAVTNGSLHVAKKWTISNEDLAAGIPLTGDAALTFASGWTLSIPDLGTLGAPNRRVLAVAADGGLTLPAVFDRGTDPTLKWHLELSEDGKRLEMARNRLVISIR